ncbi:MULTISPECIES: DUF3110 domain-containing protein [unclassified Coleofasciculus]|uniref:DUF3110 domain-containing protein n=1 Tax=unclassified Coleofasciculus TaxID=2692782 RepID=UPI001881A0FB|nr:MULTISPECIES: DUF3110 domain-containing protein [unclassified Coleofasciculus]MBE9125315.1 DUF3110 domain-containing protein [Coleofasciculus sp. LEGE 07081]MBE9148519.1 DUF3110 domain-containing protein [Coleofasciculus sp. LEGE 07092]
MVAPKRVFILLFNAGTDNEGIHTLQVGDRNVVLMFESEDDATRFGLMLEAQDFPEPTVEAIDIEEIEEFCLSTGYDSQLIEEGMLATPPEKNVEKTDWQMDTERVQEPEISDLDRIRRQLEGLL